MPREMKPGDTIDVRYWPANKPAPYGWVDAADMGHHWRGKIIKRESRWVLKQLRRLMRGMRGK